jgi:phosphoribosyl 1,2-cyclic phosphate phosphodiesterase
MTIRLLGTGAADGVPAFFTRTRVGRYAREHGGKDRRTRSAALIDGCLKIDLPPDTLHQMHRDGLDAADWTALVFTHSHDDHFAPAELQYGLWPFNDLDHLVFPIFANEAICARIREMYPDWPIEVVETASFEPFPCCDYLITPFKARHKPEEDSHNLVIERKGKCLIYATDTGFWEEETWAFLRGVRADLLVIECTNGLVPPDYFGHLNADQCVAITARLREEGTLKGDGRCVTTHHSERGDATHEELEEFFAPHRIEPGFDGMEIVL